MGRSGGYGPIELTGMLMALRGSNGILWGYIRNKSCGSTIFGCLVMAKNGKSPRGQEESWNPRGKSSINEGFINKH